MLPEVKAYLEIDSSDTSQDAVLTRMISDASTEIRSVTRRRFTKPRVTESRTLPLGSVSAYSIYVDELFEATDLTSVVDRSGDMVEYGFYPDYGYPKRGARLRLRPSRDLSEYPMDHSDWFARNMDGYANGLPGGPLVVTGTFGYAEIPEEIEYAARRTVYLRFKSERQSLDEFDEASASSAAFPDRLPPAVERSLDLWKMPRTGGF